MFWLKIFICASFLIQANLAAQTLKEKVESNHSILKREKNCCLPYLMPETHAAKPILDKIFKKRVISDLKHFLEAGFKLISIPTEKKILVAEHPDLEGYVIKVHLDDNPACKQGDPDWKWLSRRIELSLRISKFIKKNQLTKFKVAKKWLYPLNPAANGSSNNWILIAEKMAILPAEESLIYWKTKVQKKDLKELYSIMKNCGGHSYRPDNIPITIDYGFAFIDTEYPHLPPIYNEILPFISEEMGQFWKLYVLSHEMTSNSSIGALAGKKKKN